MQQEQMRIYAAKEPSEWWALSVDGKSLREDVKGWSVLGGGRSRTSASEVG